MVEQRDYQLPDGRLLAVHPGLGGDVFMTMIARPNGAMHWLKTSMLPMRAAREEAQADLDIYARQKGLEATIVMVRRTYTAKQ